MKLIQYISRIVIGITFIFSGFVKGIDPWGSAYKFTDYFNAMGLEWLIWAAFPLGVLLAFAEFAIGVALLFNFFTKFFSWMALLFMSFFLPLTLWIALKNPVSDCGCFGDALVLSNWETFYKNLVLMGFALLIFQNRKIISERGGGILPFVFSALTAIVYIVVVFYSYNHLPVFDFRPYKVGVNIPQGMEVPEDAPQAEYKTTLYYQNKKSGKIKKFAEDKIPWQDTLTWEYSNTESELIKEGFEAPIHDFTIETGDGENIADFFIYDENFVFMLVAYDLSKYNTKSQDKINELANWVLEQDLSFFCLTSSLQDESMAFAEEYDTPYEYFNCDEITLKTIVRSTPGLVVLKEGNVVGKWHFNDIPTPDEFQAEFMNKGEIK